MTNVRVAFVGPSIPNARIPAAVRERVTLLPPVKQGDVLRVVEAGATLVGIIDGYFDHVPSVWHKEILLAMERGVVVCGAASMGALRAAELASFGMTGVGRVFEMFRDGVLEDDDEVALVHAPADHDFRPMSEAMVNLRDLVERAIASGAVSRSDGASALARLKDTPYPSRTRRRLRELLPSLPDDDTPMIKERDALELLERLASSDLPPQKAPLRVERTVFLERLRLEVAHDTNLHRSAVGSASASARDVLLALLAIEHSSLLGSPATEDEVDAEIESFQRRAGLLTPEAVEAWCRARGVDAERFIRRARDEATVKKLLGVYGADVERRLRERFEWDATEGGDPCIASSSS